MMISVKKKLVDGQTYTCTVQTYTIELLKIASTSCSKLPAKLPVLRRWNLKVVSVFEAVVIA